MWRLLREGVRTVDWFEMFNGHSVSARANLQVKKFVSLSQDFVRT